MSITLKPRRRRAAPSTPTIAEREVYETAALYPMMDEETFDDLVADIKVNGLIEDIVVDQNGLLIDGRNREKACIWYWGYSLPHDRRLFPSPMMSRVTRMCSLKIPSGVI